MHARATPNSGASWPAGKTKLDHSPVNKPGTFMPSSPALNAAPSVMSRKTPSSGAPEWQARWTCLVVCRNSSSHQSIGARAGKAAAAAAAATRAPPTAVRQQQPTFVKQRALHLEEQIQALVIRSQTLDVVLYRPVKGQGSQHACLKFGSSLREQGSAMHRRFESEHFNTPDFEVVGRIPTLTASLARIRA